MFRTFIIESALAITSPVLVVFFKEERMLTVSSGKFAWSNCFLLAMLAYAFQTRHRY